MTKIITGILATLLFLGCSSKESSEVIAEPILVVNQSLESLKLNDQFEKEQTISADTKKVVFAFSKQVGHDCNDFFATKDVSYLSDKSTQFVADVSAAPSIIRSMFIMPGLKDFKHTILVIDDENVAASYTANIETEKIVVVSLENKIITGIKYLHTTDELSRNLDAY